MDIKCIGLVFSFMRLIARNASLFVKPGGVPGCSPFSPDSNPVLLVSKHAAPRITEHAS